MFGINLKRREGKRQEEREVSRSLRRRGSVREVKKKTRRKGEHCDRELKEVKWKEDDHVENTRNRKSLKMKKS